MLRAPAICQPFSAVHCAVHVKDGAVPVAVRCAGSAAPHPTARRFGSSAQTSAGRAPTATGEWWSKRRRGTWQALQHWTEERYQTTDNGGQTTACWGSFVDGTTRAPTHEGAWSRCGGAGCACTNLNGSCKRLTDWSNGRTLQVSKRTGVQARTCVRSLCAHAYMRIRACAVVRPLLCWSYACMAHVVPFQVDGAALYATPHMLCLASRGQAAHRTTHLRHQRNGRVGVRERLPQQHVLLPFP